MWRVGESKTHGVGVKDRIHDTLCALPVGRPAELLERLEQVGFLSRRYKSVVCLETDIDRLQSFGHDVPAPVRVSVTRPGVYSKFVTHYCVFSRKDQWYVATYRIDS